MASFTPSTILLFHFFLITFFFHTHMMILADDRLIQEECKPARVSKTCIQCVKSDPRSQTTDRKEIVDILINCLDNIAETLHSNFTKLAAADSDPGYKSVTQVCSKAYSKAKKYLSAGELKLKKGDYGKTKYYIDAALECNCYCDVEFEPYKTYRSTGHILDDISVYEQLATAATSIVDKFK